MLSDVTCMPMTTAPVVVKFASTMTGGLQRKTMCGAAWWYAEKNASRDGNGAADHHRGRDDARHDDTTQRDSKKITAESPSFWFYIHLLKLVCGHKGACSFCPPKCYSVY